MLERKDEEVWDILEEVIHHHPVLLNRAPTLHRMGIQAFEPVLIEGNAIKIHPLVCAGFNADFDGDQMAVHLPLSLEAQVEASTLMLATNNIFSPAHGGPIIGPSQDIVLGCYCLTCDLPEQPGEGMAFSNRMEVFLAHAEKKVNYHTKIKVYFPKGSKVKDADGLKKAKGELLDTTVGRIIFNDILPDQLPFYNYVLSKSKLNEIIADCYQLAGRQGTLKLLDDLKETGFKIATLAGLSFSTADLKRPLQKQAILDKTQAEVERIEKIYQKGVITEGERYNQIIDCWTHATELVGYDIMKELETDTRDGLPYLNPIYLMAASGARGSLQQIRQLAGMRGLMAKPSGRIIETPIKANFREGLRVLEYFSSTHGARKGLADTALKTADSGYLTRKLADVAQNVVINEHDCGTLGGITKGAVYKGEEIEVPLRKQIRGRVARARIVDVITDEVIVEENGLITAEIAERIEKALGPKGKILVRSALTCETPIGICAKCYGMDLSTGKLVEEGLAVGIIAAQSIGEPGTQLTMRTFHIGGVASKIREESEIKTRAEWAEKFENLVVSFQNLKTTLNEEGQLISLTPHGILSVTDEKDRGIDKFKVPLGAELFVKDGDTIQLSKFAVITQEHAEKYEKLIINLINVKTKKDDKGNKIVRTSKGSIIVKDEEGNEIEKFKVPSGSELYVKDGEVVNLSKLKKNKRTILLEKPKLLFSERIILLKKPVILCRWDPHMEPILAEQAGVIRFEDMVEGLTIREEKDTVTGFKRKIIMEHKGDLHPQILIKDEEGHPLGVYPIPDKAHVTVEDGQKITVGTLLAKTPREIVGTQDITGGLPRVTELFEVRKPKNPAVISEIDGVVELGEKRRGKRTIIVRNESGMEREHLIPPGKHLRVHKGTYVKAGDPLVDGPLVPHDILKISGEEAVQQYLLSEVQKVYRSQNVSIDDKHIEIIIAQMLRRVKLEDPGDTEFLPGSISDKFKFRYENQKIQTRGGKPSTAKPLLLGITKASLYSDSFISAASFQETTKVLTEAALAGKVDELLGLKENVILGHMIPAGTGFKGYYAKKVKKMIAEELISEPAGEEGERMAI
jgi:DNA-directed RNA polymerase subunit beta'